MKPSLGMLVRSSINNECSVRLSILISAEHYKLDKLVFKYSIYEFETNGIVSIDYSDECTYCKPVGEFAGKWTCVWRP
jgi:hypothetical protein